MNVTARPGSVLPQTKCIVNTGCKTVQKRSRHLRPGALTSTKVHPSHTAKTSHGTNQQQTTLGIQESPVHDVNDRQQYPSATSDDRAKELANSPLFDQSESGSSVDSGTTVMSLGAPAHTSNADAETVPKRV